MLGRSDKHSIVEFLIDTFNLTCSFHKSPSTHNDNTVTAKEIDTPLYTHEEKTTPAEKLKPITVTEPKPPRRPSNGPVYATPWSLKKKSNKESKKDKHGASREKSGESTIRN